MFSIRILSNTLAEMCIESKISKYNELNFLLRLLDDGWRCSMRQMTAAGIVVHTHSTKNLCFQENRSHKWSLKCGKHFL